MIGLFIHGIFYDEQYPDFFNDFIPEVWDKEIIKYPVMLGIAVIILSPLCLLKDISKMRFASILGILSLTYTVIVIIAQCYSYFSYFLDKNNINDINWFDFSTGFSNKLYFFTGTATVFFAYTCHIGALPVYKTLRNNTSKRINKVFLRSIILDCSFYILVGVSGFLTIPINTPELIIYRKSIYTNDMFMIIGRLLIAINLILCLPGNYNAFRLSFMELLGLDIDNISNIQ